MFTPAVRICFFVVGAAVDQTRDAMAGSVAALATASCTGLFGPLVQGDASLGLFVAVCLLAIAFGRFAIAIALTSFSRVDFRILHASFRRSRRPEGRGTCFGPAVRRSWGGGRIAKRIVQHAAAKQPSQGSAYGCRPAVLQNAPLKAAPPGHTATPRATVSYRHQMIVPSAAPAIPTL